MSLEHSPQRRLAHLPVTKRHSSTPLLTVAQVSEIIGRSISTLEKDRLEGNGPPYVKMGRVSFDTDQPTCEPTLRNAFDVRRPIQARRRDP